MTNLQLSIIFLFISGLMITTYKDYARKKGWAIGEYFDSDSSILRILGTISFLGSFIAGFFHFKWYFVVIGAVVGWIISLLITNIMKTNSQWISTLLLVIGFVLLVIYFFKS
ncbi:hypothetical protein [Aquimarina macrocephali]|uniref:hypothetical protein n=1 Tax=Aquimarina macrocephali TaxID=666563 RepID=UPI0004BA2F02|nr:hypothetical protein [Aquimarina macrocephali]